MGRRLFALIANFYQERNRLQSSDFLKLKRLVSQTACGRLKTRGRSNLARERHVAAAVSRVPPREATLPAWPTRLTVPVSRLATAICGPAGASAQGPDYRMSLFVLFSSWRLLLASQGAQLE
jgi:hypothetical protein